MVGIFDRLPPVPLRANLKFNTADAKRLAQYFCLSLSSLCRVEEV